MNGAKYVANMLTLGTSLVRCGLINSIHFSPGFLLDVLSDCPPIYAQVSVSSGISCHPIVTDIGLHYSW